MGDDPELAQAGEALVGPLPVGFLAEFRHRALPQHRIAQRADAELGAAVEVGQASMMPGSVELAVIAVTDAIVRRLNASPQLQSRAIVLRRLRAAVAVGHLGTYAMPGRGSAPKPTAPAFGCTRAGVSSIRCGFCAPRRATSISAAFNASADALIHVVVAILGKAPHEAHVRRCFRQLLIPLEYRFVFWPRNGVVGVSFVARKLPHYGCAGRLLTGQVLELGDPGVAVVVREIDGTDGLVLQRGQVLVAELDRAVR